MDDDKNLQSNGQGKENSDSMPMEIAKEDIESKPILRNARQEPIIQPIPGHYPPPRRGIRPWMVVLMAIACLFIGGLVVMIGIVAVSNSYNSFSSYTSTHREVESPMESTLEESTRGHVFQSASAREIPWEGDGQYTFAVTEVENIHISGNQAQVKMIFDEHATDIVVDFSASPWVNENVFVEGSILSQNGNSLILELYGYDTLSPEIVIVMPRGHELPSLNIDFERGKIDIEDAQINTLTIQGRTTNIQIENSNIVDMQITAEKSNIHIDSLRGNYTRISGEATKVDMEEIYLSDLYISSQVGDIDIDSYDIGIIDISSQVGQISLDNAHVTTDNYQVAIQSELGNVEYEIPEEIEGYNFTYNCVGDLLNVDFPDKDGFTVNRYDGGRSYSNQMEGANGIISVEVTTEIGNQKIK